MENERFYLEILDFIKDNAGSDYTKPERAENQEVRIELEGLRDFGRNASDNMCYLCDQFSKYYNLKYNPPIRWLRMNNQTIRDYLWVQLKSKEHDNLPFSISIFAEHDQFRLSLEIDCKKATPDDYITYHKYFDLPIEQHLIFWSKQNNAWDVLYESQDTVKQIVKNQTNNDSEHHIQICYIIPRKNSINKDNTSQFFYNEFITGFTLLLPYYNYVISQASHTPIHNRS